MSQKYRKELTPNITFQPNKIFVRNDLFERIIKSCKITNFEKLGLCLYEVIDEQKFISTSEEKIITQNNVENEQLIKENEQLRKENDQLRKENEQLNKNDIAKNDTIKNQKASGDKKS